MFYRAILVLTLLAATPAFGQRLFQTVKPVDPDKKFRFDTNEIPIRDLLAGARQTDLNFSPNIVFAPNRDRAFVSYSSSNRVMAFKPSTGEVESLIEVGENPGLLSLTPDGKKIALPSLFLKDNLPQGGGNFEGKLIGSISVIDVETLAVRTLNLTKVFFSVANNIVLSADGKTGFIASAGTDEVLRINLETMAEITPRLKMTVNNFEGTRPISLTMAPDHSFFTVVLVGSTSLAIQDVPDSVKVVDTASFTVRQTLEPTVPQGDLRHNFLATNNVAISSDGKFALIADQARSSSPFATIPALTPDRAFVFDLATGKEIDRYEMAGVSTWAAWVQGTNLFVVVGALEIGVVDPVAKKSTRISIPPGLTGDLLETSRPTFSNNGRFLYVAAPMDDVLLQFDLVTGEVNRRNKLGDRIKLSEIDEIPAAPMHVALSPDESILAAVNFNANSVALVRNTFHFNVPRIPINTDWFTGIALTNASEQTAQIISTGYNNQGIEFQDEKSTTDVVEFVNPQTHTLAPGRQLARTAAEFIGAATGQQFQGWIGFDSNQFEVGSFFLTGDFAGKRLDGSPVFTTTSPSVVATGVRVTDGFNTELSVHNPSLNLSSFTVTLFNSQGEKKGEKQIDQLIGRGVNVDFLRDPNPADEQVQGHFPESAFEGFTSGYVVVSSATAVGVYVRYFDAERMSALAGFPLAASSAQATSYFVPQVAAFGGSNTFLTLLNSGDAAAALQITLRGNNGSVVAGPVALNLAAKQLVRRSVAELFQLSDPGSTIAGWVSINSDRSGIVGDAEIQVWDGRAMSTIPIQRRTSRRLLFSHVAQGLGFSTGLALINPTETAAQVSIEVFSPEGQLVGDRDLSLAPGERQSKLLNEFISGLPGQIGGYVKVTSTQGLLGAQFFFSDNLAMLSVVPGQSLEDLDRTF